MENGVGLGMDVGNGIRVGTSIEVSGVSLGIYDTDDVPNISLDGVARGSAAIILPERVA